jgi:Ca-activated chloride channel homolog
MNNFMHSYFLGLLLIVPVLFWYFYNQKKNLNPTLKISTTNAFQIKNTWVEKCRPYLFVLPILSFICLVIALARPRDTEKSNFLNTKNGIDIIIATDVSGSMLANDFIPNRLEAIKEVGLKFIKQRTNDRIGLVVYAGESYTRTPLTSDKALLIETFKQTRHNSNILEDGTAIGVGLATAINRLKDSKTKTKVIILLTDGVNTLGSLDPIAAAEIAKTYNIKVYTIGVGTNGMAKTPVAKDPLGNIIYQDQKVEIDESLLQEVAKISGGKYFRATSKDKLEKIYSEIDQLEKSKIPENQTIMFDEYFRIWALLAMLFLVLEMVLTQTVFKSFIA